MRKTFIETLVELAKADPSIFVITGDAGFGVFEGFRELFPDRYLNAGVAEQNMIGVAAGLAMAGFRPFVYNIIPFVLYRCYEQVRNDLCYQRLPVTLVGIGSGLTYAPSGMTHYSVEDLGLCLTLPNLEAYSPGDPTETEACVRHAATAAGPCYIRVAKAGEPRLREHPVDLGRPGLLHEGDDINLLVHGSLAEEARQACLALAGQGVSARLLCLPRVHPLPLKELLAALAPGKPVMVCEEHFQGSGLYARLAQAFAQDPSAPLLVPACLPDRFIHTVAPQAALREAAGIDAAGLARRALAVLGSRAG